MSLRWYADVFIGPESDKFKQAAINSLTIAIIAATDRHRHRHAAATAMVRGGQVPAAHGCRSA